MLSDLITVISRVVPLSPADQALCEQYFQPLAIKKSTVLVPPGSVPRHLYFITKGYMRLCYADERGEDVTTHLGCPHDFITPFLGFVHQQAAPEGLAAITACEALQIAHPDLAALIQASEAFKQFSLLIFEQAMGAASRRANGLATLSAEQRYRQLLAQRPDVLLHVPVQQVASFLGIKPESLSRIRRQTLS